MINQDLYHKRPGTVTQIMCFPGTFCHKEMSICISLSLMILEENWLEETGINSLPTWLREALMWQLLKNSMQTYMSMRTKNQCKLGFEGIWQNLMLIPSTHFCRLQLSWSKGRACHFTPGLLNWGLILKSLHLGCVSLGGDLYLMLKAYHGRSWGKILPL